ncbi:MAG: HNH endonuclease [Campylobacterota bacterium]|nr:HNH endonuclease [Campylobacterota bacterium]
MIYFKKSQPSPTITKSHNTPEIVQRLTEDFHNKCYICEEKAPKDINVEHFIAHQGDETLKLDWNNLFLSCSHCNNIKSNDYNNLLNCTILTDNVDTSLHYYCNPMPKEKPVFDILIPSIKATQTKELLEKCFNGEHTGQKTLESSNLRDLLLKEILIFQRLLFEYVENDDKEYFLIKIKEHLSNRSSFTAFKRWIIRDNNYLKTEFEQYIID